MYTAFVNGQIFYYDVTPDPKWKVISPTLSMEENNAGAFSFTITPKNDQYANIEEMNSVIQVKRNDIWYWEGRVNTVDVDFFNQKVVHCEGALAYLNDTYQPPRTIKFSSMKDLLSQLLDIHNKKVSLQKVTNTNAVSSYLDRRIYVGNVTYRNISGEYDTAYNTTMENLNSILESFPAKIKIVRRDGDNGWGLYLDVYQTYGDYHSDLVGNLYLGISLLDFSKSVDMTDYCNVVIPLGKVYEDYRCAVKVDISKYITNKTVGTIGKNGGVSGTTGWVTDYIPVKGQNYRFFIKGTGNNGSMQYACYDSKKKFLSGSSTEEGKTQTSDLKDSASIDETAAYIRIASYNNVGVELYSVKSGTEKRVNGGTKTDPTGMKYVEHTESVERYGRIEKAQIWDDIEDEATLTKLGSAYLLTMGQMNFTVKAIDLRKWPNDVPIVNEFDLYQKIRVWDRSHGLVDLALPVTELEIVLDKPTAATIKLGMTGFKTLSAY